MPMLFSKATLCQAISSLAPVGLLCAQRGYRVDSLVFDMSRPIQGSFGSVGLPKWLFQHLFALLVGMDDAGASGLEGLLLGRPAVSLLVCLEFLPGIGFCGIGFSLVPFE